MKSECKKFGENSRQMAPVSTICDEYCSVVKGLVTSRIVLFLVRGLYCEWLRETWRQQLLLMLLKQQ